MSRFVKLTLIVRRLGAAPGRRPPVGAARDRPAGRAGSDPQAHGPRRDHRGHRSEPVHRPAGDQALPAGGSPGSRALRGVRAVRRPPVTDGAPALPRPHPGDRPDRAVAPDRAHGPRRVQLLGSLRGDEGTGAGAEPCRESLDGDGGAPRDRARPRAGRRPSRLAGVRVGRAAARRRREGSHDAGRRGARPADRPGAGQRDPRHRRRRPVAARAASIRRPGVRRGVRDAAPESVRLHPHGDPVSPDRREVQPGAHRGCR